MLVSVGIDRLQNRSHFIDPVRGNGRPQLGELRVVHLNAIGRRQLGFKSGRAFRDRQIGCQVKTKGLERNQRFVADLADIGTRPAAHPTAFIASIIKLELRGADRLAQDFLARTGAGQIGLNRHLAGLPIKPHGQGELVEGLRLQTR